jgi:hypothetical protein
VAVITDIGYTATGGVALGNVNSFIHVHGQHVQSERGDIDANPLVEGENLNPIKCGRSVLLHLFARADRPEVIA